MPVPALDSRNLKPLEEFSRVAAAAVEGAERLGGVALAKAAGAAYHDELLIRNIKRGVEGPYEPRLVDVGTPYDAGKSLVAWVTYLPMPHAPR